MSQCRICGSRDLTSFEAQEMMFGLREPFTYQECLTCKSLQIEKIPADLSKYYPSDYNAYHKGSSKSDSLLKKIFKKKLANDYLTGHVGPISKFLIARFGLGYIEKMKGSGVNLHSRILDVGTGNGARLLGLKKYGFQNLTGIEPFIDNDIHYKNGVSVYAQDIYSHEGEYDLIMFNHVFEHVPDPAKVLERAKQLLSKDGTIQISIPVADSEAFTLFRENWVALDPPRHLHVFSSIGIKAFVRTYDLEVYDTLYDGSSYQFWGSKQYQENIPLRSENSYYSSPEKSIFSREDIAQFEKRAKELNQVEKGDTACFYIKRMDH